MKNVKNMLDETRGMVRKLAMDEELDGVDLRVFLYLAATLDFREYALIEQRELADVLGRRREHISRSIRRSLRKRASSLKHSRGSDGRRLMSFKTRNTASDREPRRGPSKAASFAGCQSGAGFLALRSFVRDFRGPEKFGADGSQYRNDPHVPPSFVGILDQLAYNKGSGNHSEMKQVASSP